VPRTVVYDDPIAQARLAEDDPGGKPTAAARKKVNRRTEPATEAEKTQAVELPVKDDYTAKIAKYVPAEVVAVSVAGFAAYNPTGRWIWFGIALGIVANLVYLNRHGPEDVYSFGGVFVGGLGRGNPAFGRRAQLTNVLGE
jgi:hypothetical protein